MKDQIIGLILIIVCIIYFYAIANYNVVQALYGIGAPFDAMMVFAGVGFAMGIVGFCMLISDSKK
jgi:hypothetical protein